MFVTTSTPPHEGIVTLALRRAWWILLPYAGWMGYRHEGMNRIPLHAYPLAWLWSGVSWYMTKRGIGAFPPSPPVVCRCDYCRGVPGAVFEP